MASKNNTPRWLLVIIAVTGVLFTLNGLMSLLRSPDIYDVFYLAVGLVMVFSGFVALRK